jgi:large repetitive protein
LNFAAGTTVRTINVPVVGDTLDEPNQAFVVNLSGAANATIATSQGTGTITDNDATPSLAINNLSVTEGDSGTTNAAFAVTLSAASGQTVTVNYGTANGTATAPADFTATSGTLTFAAGTTTQTINVPIVGDTTAEATQTFVVNLSGAANATIATSQGTGTILDNDTHALAVNNVSVTEGNSGTTNAIFTVTLSFASAQTVTVNYATSNGTATAGSTADYTATSGSLSFAPGTTSRQVTVAVRGDTLDEPDETFNVTLSNAANATIADNLGVGTIVDNDAAPAISINNVSLTEGLILTKTATFTVTLSAASGRTVTVSYATANGTAVATSDYTAEAGTVTFAPGTTSQSITISVRGDSTRESNETFFVNLTNPVNATIVDSQGIGTILNDD